MKKQKSDPESIFNRFDHLSEEIVFLILDFLNDDPLDKKSFSLVCKSFYAFESRHRKTLKPLRSEHLTKILIRYPFISHLDLSLCPKITDSSLGLISGYCKQMLRSINLSRSKFFSHIGLSNLLVNCRNLVEIDLSNATDLKDIGAACIAKAKNLEKLWLVRCKSVTDIGIGCIAVGCRKLKLLSLKCCFGVSDLGVGLVAVKCKEIHTLDLSYLQITTNCLSQVLELQHLEDLVLEGCFGIDDDGLIQLKQQCTSLETLDISSCQNVTHVGLSSLTSAARCLQKISLSYGSQVDLALADSLRKLSMLQTINLDGCHIVCSALKSIGDWCVTLTELSLSKCLGVTDEELSALVTKRIDLKKLDITCCRAITYASVAHIANFCPSLTSLRMESCTKVSAQAFVLIGQRCHFLEELDLTENNIDDEGLKSMSRCSQLKILKLGICPNISDKGLIHIGSCCSKLKELDLYRSAGITDSSILAIAQGCKVIETINIAYCKNITDRSLISLAKCSKLSTLESRACPLITSFGLSAIAMGCKQLMKLDIKKCHNIDDSGMIPLARFSRNLRQINLSYTSVTDIGLLSLANVSCLQNMTVLHLEGLTPRGLAAALLACGGITKVKLQSSFKSLLSPPIIEHLESRGCVFQWREKVLQTDLDNKSWKLQLTEDE